MKIYSPKYVVEFSEDNVFFDKLEEFDNIDDARQFAINDIEEMCDYLAGQNYVVDFDKMTIVMGGSVVYKWCISIG